MLSDSLLLTTAWAAIRLSVYSACGKERLLPGSWETMFDHLITVGLRQGQDRRDCISIAVFLRCFNRRVYSSLKRQFVFSFVIRLHLKRRQSLLTISFERLKHHFDDTEGEADK